MPIAFLKNLTRFGLKRFFNISSLSERQKSKGKEKISPPVDTKANHVFQTYTGNIYYQVPIFPYLLHHFSLKEEFLSIFQKEGQRDIVCVDGFNALLTNLCADDVLASGGRLCFIKIGTRADDIVRKTFMPKEKTAAYQKIQDQIILNRQRAGR